MFFFSYYLEIWSKTIEHLFYATSSSEHYFVAISDFKLELQSGNAQLGYKSSIFLSPMTLKFDGWPWKTIGHLFYAISIFLHHVIWPSVNSNWSYSPETPNSKIGIFLSRVTSKFDGRHWKTIGHLSHVTSSSVHHFIAIGEFKLELQSGNTQFRSKLAIFFSCDLEIWGMTL